MYDTHQAVPQVLIEYDVNEAVTYGWGAGLQSRKDNGSVRFYHGDGLGSVRQLTDSSGSVTDTYGYDAYGNHITQSGSTANAYRFAGEPWDEATGLVYLWHRYYDPSVQRFLTEDPAQDGGNWYAYVGNNPVNWMDPWGLHWDDHPLGTITIPPYDNSPLDDYVLLPYDEWGNGHPFFQNKLTGNIYVFEQGDNGYRYLIPIGSCTRSCRDVVA